MRAQLQLAIEFRRQLGIGHGCADRKQVAHALDFIQFADFLGSVELLLIQVDGSGRRHNAILRHRLQMAKLVLLSQLLRHPRLDVAVVAGACGGSQAGAGWGRDVLRDYLLTLAFWT